MRWLSLILVLAVVERATAQCDSRGIPRRDAEPRRYSCTGLPEDSPWCKEDDEFDADAGVPKSDVQALQRPFFECMMWSSHFSKGATDNEEFCWRYARCSVDGERRECRVSDAPYLLQQFVKGTPMNNATPRKEAEDGF